MQRTHQCLDISFELGDLLGVCLELLEPPDLMAQTPLAVRRPSPGPDLLAELRLQVGAVLDR
ncbi:hypothetical protein [Streptomyces olivaceoviridis]|uniref:hypothetical protein n=1 Tax=Streptomyces olivaceoviridis TaxID=1921 RepID=UPI00167BB7D4|nr:hypothetical protein [Streptomyces olivaceoviridis]